MTLIALGGIDDTMRHLLNGEFKTMYFCILLKTKTKSHSPFESISPSCVLCLRLLKYYLRIREKNIFLVILSDHQIIFFQVQEPEPHDRENVSPFVLFVVKSQIVSMKMCFLNVCGSLVLLSPCILVLQGKTYFDEQEQAGNVRKSGAS